MVGAPSSITQQISNLTITSRSTNRPIANHSISNVDLRQQRIVVRGVASGGVAYHVAPLHLLLERLGHEGVVEPHVRIRGGGGVAFAGRMAAPQHATSSPPEIRKRRATTPSSAQRAGGGYRRATTGL